MRGSDADELYDSTGYESEDEHQSPPWTSDEEENGKIDDAEDEREKPSERRPRVPPLNLFADARCADALAAVIERGFSVQQWVEVWNLRAVSRDCYLAVHNDDLWKQMYSQSAQRGQDGPATAPHTVATRPRRGDARGAEATEAGAPHRRTFRGVSPRAARGVQGQADRR